MTERLILLDDLRAILGYQDNRSVRSWCSRMNIPLFGLGKRTYTLSNFIEQYLENAIQTFADANYDNPSEIMDALKNDDAIKFCKKAEPKKKQKIENPEMSEASLKFLNTKK